MISITRDACSIPADTLAYFPTVLIIPWPDKRVNPRNNASFQVLSSLMERTRVDNWRFTDQRLPFPCIKLGLIGERILMLITLLAGTIDSIVRE